MDHNRQRWSDNKNRGEKLDNSELIEYALNKGPSAGNEWIDKVKKIANVYKISSSQLRNLYDIVVELDPNEETENKKKLVKLRIMIAYAKNRKNIDLRFADNLDSIVKKILEDAKPEKIEKFKQFMEALVAFSKG